MAGKTKMAVNCVWSIMKSAKIVGLRKNLLLMDSLVKSEALHAMKIRGWRRREEIKKVHSRIVTAALGVARNTPDYLWKLEAGRRLEIETRRKTGNYLIEILKMKNRRWTKNLLYALY